MGKTCPVADNETSPQDRADDLPVDSWLTVREVADTLGMSPNAVRRLVHDHQLAMVRRPGEPEPEIPTAFLHEGMIVKGLGGTLTLLADHGFDDWESIEWLFTPDDSLPGRPIDALRADRGTEVRRRAQVIV